MWKRLEQTPLHHFWQSNLLPHLFCAWCELCAWCEQMTLQRVLTNALISLTVVINLQGSRFTPLAYFMTFAESLSITSFPPPRSTQMDKALLILTSSDSLASSPYCLCENHQCLTCVISKYAPYTCRTLFSPRSTINIKFHDPKLRGWPFHQAFSEETCIKPSRFLVDHPSNQLDSSTEASGAHSNQICCSLTVWTKQWNLSFLGLSPPVIGFQLQGILSPHNTHTHEHYH